GVSSYRASPVERSSNRRRATCGCGLSGSDRLRARQRPELADAMNVYEFHRGTTPLLISIPHSGTELPEPLAHRLTVVGRAYRIRIGTSTNCMTSRAGS